VTHDDDAGMTLVCVCGFETKSADDLMTHMLETGHIVPDELRAAMADGGGIAELTDILAQLQRDPQSIIDRSEPVDPDDDDVPPEVRAAYEQTRARARRQRAPGEELLAATLRSPDEPYEIDVVLFVQQPRGELRLRDRGGTVVRVTRPIGLEDIAALQAKRADLLQPLLDAMVAEAKKETKH
jgi:hypothetical protein